MNPLRITLIGGPTALIEIDGIRILTDPTFDAPGAYQLPHVKLEKLSGAAQTRGPFHLTMDTNDTIETARAFPDAVIRCIPMDGRTSARTRTICARRSIRSASGRA